MKIKISLQTYLDMGGLLENIDWHNSKCDYGKYAYKQIVSCKDYGEVSSDGTSKLLDLSFDNGEVKRFSIIWISIEVDFLLHGKYTNSQPNTPTNINQ